MPIIATTPEGKDFKIASEGTVQGVLNSVEDLGLEDVIFQGVAKKVHKIRIWWQLAELDEDGKTPIFLPEKFTLSLHEKAQLFKRVKGMYGKQPPATLDIEKLIGWQGNLVIVHNASDKKLDSEGKPKVYANVAATLKLQANQKKLEIVARPKREKSTTVAPKSNAITEANPISDEDIPF